MNYRFFVGIFTLALIFGSCGSKKRATKNGTVQRSTKTEPIKDNTSRTGQGTGQTQTDNPDTTIATPAELSYTEAVAWYIDTFSQVAKEEMALYGIPASITMAQGILESGAGRSDLTRRANNHFGIKCHTEWKGARVYHDDDAAQECFRKYIDAKYSFRDHSLFLTQRSRYKGLFDLRKDDYKAWAKGLKRAGYATDPKYPAKLISIIERYDLASLDDEVLGNSGRGRNTRVANTDSESYVVKQGDTLYSIARRHNLSVDELKSKNGLKSNTISIGQTLNVGSEKN